MRKGKCLDQLLTKVSHKQNLVPDMPQDVKDIKRLTSCKTQDGTFFKECRLPQGWPSTEYAT